MKHYRPLTLAAVILSLSLLLCSCSGGGGSSISSIAVDSTGSMADDLVSCVDPPINPRFNEYLKDLAAGTVVTVTDDGHGLGHIPGPQNTSHLTLVDAQWEGRRALAPSYDLRWFNRVSPVKDQGVTALCWVFAGIGSLESCLLGKGETWSFSENNLPHWCHENGYTNDWCNSGYDQKAFASLAAWQGPVKGTDDPFIDDYHNPWHKNAPVQKHLQNAYFFAPRDNALDNDIFKHAIADNGGVVLNFYFDKNYCISDQINNRYSYYYSGNAGYANHEVVAVGWDDNYSRDNFANPIFPDVLPKGDGAFLCKNSWGTAWGDKGFFYISYYDAKLANDAYDSAVQYHDAQSITNYKTNYQYDYLGWLDHRGTGTSETYWGANVFTATATGQIEAVATYCIQNCTSYEISLYNNVTNSPTAGTEFAAARTGGTRQIAGYYTIPLAMPVPVKKGEKFSVIVKYTTPKLNYPLPIQEPSEFYHASCTSAHGQSFVSDDGEIWADLYDIVTNGTVCIKAFAN